MAAATLTPSRAAASWADQPSSRATGGRLVSDLAALTDLLHEDALTEMPPWRHWMRGREAVGDFLVAIFGRRAPGGWRVLTTGANRQPAMASYRRGDDGIFRANNIQLFTITGEGISHMVAFIDPTLFSAFRLPNTV